MKSRHDHPCPVDRTFLAHKLKHALFSLEPRATRDTSEFRDVSPPAAGPARRARANEKPKRTTRQAPDARARQAGARARGRAGGDALVKL